MALKERLETFYNITPANSALGELDSSIHFDVNCIASSSAYSTLYEPLGYHYSERDVLTKTAYDSLKTPSNFRNCYCVSTYYYNGLPLVVIDFYAFSSLLTNKNYDYYFAVEAEIDNSNWIGSCWSMETSNCTFVESESAPYYEIGVYQTGGSYVSPRPFRNYTGINPPSGPYPFFLQSSGDGYESEAYSKIVPHYNPYGFNPNTSNCMVYRYTMWFRFGDLGDIEQLAPDEWSVDCSLYRYPALTPTEAPVDSSAGDVFNLIKSGFDTATSFFSYEVFSGVTIGSLLSIPVILSLLLAVFKLIRK